MFSGKIIDSHFHAYAMENCEVFAMDLIQRSGLSAINIVSLPKGLGYDAGSCNEMGLAMKRGHPGKFYFFGALDYSDESYLDGKIDFVEQARMLLDSGADGIKMIEGKPDARRLLGLRLDAPLFHSFYNYMEKESIPILMHVADPEEFWDAGKVDEAVRRKGWFWGDGKHQLKEDLYAEAEGVLTQFPRLKVIFAHFSFMSSDIVRASAFLERWENVSLDLAPGWEMYHNFTNDRSAWSVFFNAYQDRIIFGTDNTPPSPGNHSRYAEQMDYCAAKITRLRNFLETGGEVFSGSGLNLHEKTLSRIYSDNFLRVISR